jgi:hypothetical protein
MTVFRTWDMDMIAVKNVRDLGGIDYRHLDHREHDKRHTKSH